MNIIEAIKSRRPRRFPNSQSIVNQDWHTSGLYDSNDVLTEGWEIQEPTVTVTRTQFLAAVKATSWSFLDQTHTRVEPTLWSIQDLARRLGLVDAP